MKYVKFARGNVGVVTSTDAFDKGVHEVTFHNGIKPVHRFFNESALTEITMAEFEHSIRKKGQTSMLQYLTPTTVAETIVWHTDPKDLPETNRRCLVFTLGCSGVEGRAVWTGLNWRMSDGFRNEKNWIKAWAYEPRGPK